jgi:hypothetical protein
MNAHVTKTPPGQTAGLRNASSIGIGDSSKPIKTPAVTQARIDLLADDIVDTTGWFIDQLNCLPAQRAAGDYTGMIYTLRRARAYWIAISGSTKELVERNDERLSGLRQGSDQ